MAEHTTTQLQLWIDALNAGKPGARDRLLEHAQQRLTRLAHKMLRIGGDRVGDFEATGDVVQNTNIRLMRRLESVSVPTVAEFLRLVAREMRRELIDLGRHHFGPMGGGQHLAPVPARAAGDTSPPYEPGDDTLSPEKLAAWAEFHTAVEALPEEEREVFDLRWYEELTQLEAAGVIGVSEATVKRRWLAARLRLQKALKGGPPGW